VERATFRAEDALERLPGEIVDVADSAELSSELSEDLVERGDERLAGALAVDGRFDLGACAPVLRVEHEELDEAATVRRRSNAPVTTKLTARRSGARAGEITPGVRRHEGLHRRGLALLVVVALVVITLVVIARRGRLAREKLRERDALAVDERKAVHERR